jgi:hypothetical protein
MLVCAIYRAQTFLKALKLHDYFFNPAVIFATVFNVKTARNWAFFNFSIKSTKAEEGTRIASPEISYNSRVA